MYKIEKDITIPQNIVEESFIEYKNLLPFLDSDFFDSSVLCNLNNYVLTYNNDVVGVFIYAKTAPFIFTTQEYNVEYALYILPEHRKQSRFFINTIKNELKPLITSDLTGMASNLYLKCNFKQFNSVFLYE